MAGAAEPAAAAQPLLGEARAKALAEHPYWLALLHYRRGRAGAAHSEIVSPEFFLSPEGATDPQAELEATLAAFFEPPGEAPDLHAQCRFVARYKWLRKALDWRAANPPEVQCPQYQAYTLGDQVESLSLVYATGFLSNPASAYGHILLKFNTRRSVVAADLLDRSLNFGALVPAGENRLLYVLKGLFGGYDAAFSHQQFYHFNHAYTEEELRDMWEYVLTLDRDEVEQIVAHSWELLGKRYTYYFLKDNCGYRMAELLELVLDEQVLPNRPYSLPATVFERIVEIEHHGEPLVREVKLIPSRQNRFRGRYLQLDAAEQAAARELVASDLALDDVAYQTLPESGKVAVVDTLLDYYEFRSIADEKDVDAERAKHRLLIERSSLLPQRGRDAPPSPGIAPPHQGPLPLLARAGALHNNRLGDGMELRVRPANYDRLALDAGRIPHSTLKMFGLTVVQLDGRLQLRSLDLVEIENLNVADTPLPSDGGWAWNFGLGLQAQDLECRDCTRLRSAAGIGGAASFGAEAVAVAMLEFSAQSGLSGYGNLSTTPRLGLIVTLASGWKSFFSVGERSYFDGPRDHRRLTRWENRIGSDRRWDVRVVYEENVAHEVSAGVSLYW